MKNKLYLIALATVLTIAITACGKQEEVIAPAPTVAEEPAIVEEPTVAEEPTVVEEPAPTVAEEPTIVEEPAVVDEPTDYEWIVTDEEVAALSESDAKFVRGVYKFLTYHFPELEETEDLKYMANEYVKFSTNGGSLLELVNKDFSAAYDIIEECGIDVTTDEGVELKAAEMRMEITDYDTFFDAFNEVIEYTGEIAEYSMKYSDGIDAINAGEVTDYDEAMSYLNGYDLFTYYIESLDAVTDKYHELSSPKYLD